MTYSNKQLKKARLSFCRGDRDAVQVIERIAAEGDGGAAASLAQIRAFEGRWSEAVDLAIQALRTNDPEQLSTANIRTDLIDVLGRAALESHRFPDVIAFCEEAIKECEAQGKGPVPLYKGLLAYAGRNGAPPHYCWSVKDWSEFAGEDVYESQLEANLKHWPKVRTIPNQLHEKQLWHAVACGHQDKAIELWEQHGTTIHGLLFDASLLMIAKAYINRGNPDTAWEVLSKHLDYWLPMDGCQMLPVALIADYQLRTLMTPERCEFLLNADKTPHWFKKNNAKDNAAAGGTSKDALASGGTAKAALASAGTSKDALAAGDLNSNGTRPEQRELLETYKALLRDFRRKDDEGEEEQAWNEPASEEEIAEAEAKLGIKLPPDVKSLYRMHNGQPYGSTPVFLHWHFLSLDAMVQEWEVWQDVVTGLSVFERQADACGPVKPDIFCKQWIPFTSDGCGNNHCFDLAPEPEGHAGQIVIVWHDDTERPVIAFDIWSWLKKVIADIQQEPHGNSMIDSMYSRMAP